MLKHLKPAITSACRTFILLWMILVLPIIITGQLQDRADAQLPQPGVIVLNGLGDPSLVPPPGYPSTP